MSRLRLMYLFLVSMLASTLPSYAQDDDEVITLNTTITGNQEQPTVMYIVPWKQAADDSILYQPLKRQMSAVFGHIERPEHERQVQYLEKMANPTKK